MGAIIKSLEDFRGFRVEQGSDVIGSLLEFAEPHFLHLLKGHHNAYVTGLLKGSKDSKAKATKKIDEHKPNVHNKCQGLSGIGQDLLGGGH